MTIPDPVDHSSCVPHVVFDLDGTLCPQTLGVALMRLLARRGICAPEPVAHLEAFLADLPLHEPRTPEQDTHIYRLFCESLVGVSVSAVRRTAADVWATSRDGLFPYVRPLIGELKERGYRVALISGSPHEVVEEVASDLEVNTCQGAILEADGSTYTGRSTLLPGLPGGKTRVLRGFMRTCCMQKSVAIGDSTRDLELLSRVGRAVAFEPDTPLQRAALRGSWPVVDRHTCGQTLLTLLPPLHPAGHGP
ncbi:HAD family hydrolase [Streptomyces griseoluteus]|uniref:HAD family hydrolase n=1 Tax=Streptomyces griseoluteus TaxID=29306 RepID=UPI00380259CF